MNDRVIRELLFAFLDASNAKIRVFDELVINDSRADIVAVTNLITGFEIKGDGDSYTRLPLQIEEYSRHFERNYLVVGARHRKSSASHVPDYWGIVTVGESGVEVVREAVESPKFKWKLLLKLLWRKELAHILAAAGRKPSDFRGKTKTFMVNTAIKLLPPEQLRPLVCTELFERDYTLLKPRY
jgi:hypothetical protein